MWRHVKCVFTFLTEHIVLLMPRLWKHLEYCSLMISFFFAILWNMLVSHIFIYLILFFKLFKLPLEKEGQVGGPILAQEELKTIFGSIPDIYEVHTRIKVICLHLFLSKPILTKLLWWCHFCCWVVNIFVFVCDGLLIRMTSRSSWQTGQRTGV